MTDDPNRKPDPKRAAADRELADLSDRIKALHVTAKLTLAKDLYGHGRLEMAERVVEMALLDVRLDLLRRKVRP